MSKFESLKRKIVHRLIVNYLIKCGGAFHHGAYGENGKYVALMSDKKYHDYQNL
ncbi:hypothetical protein [Bhargavaea ginsengi]|uniref:hypothetical protein n=1 Tax=Bhargavaea ginsengi TaxID=426757 RepID=UPI003C7528EF